MKKTILTALLAVIASTGIAQVYNSDVQQDVRDFIYASGCTYLTTDTVTLPVRSVLSLDYAVTALQREIQSKLNSKSSNLRTIIEDSYATLQQHMERTQELFADYNNPQPASNVGLDYQRVQVKTPQGEVFSIYTRVGKYTMSEYATFKCMDTFKDILSTTKEIRETLDTYYELCVE